MSDNIEEVKESLKLNIQGSVKEAFNKILDESQKDKVDEEEDYDDESEKDKDNVNEEEDKDKEEKDDDSEESDEDDEETNEGEGKKRSKKLKESMTVDAMPANSRGRGKTVTHNISRMSDLVKLANSGKYEYFTVSKRNGEEEEYHVDFSRGKPKLVKM
jgi:hypothetical protein